jgi:Nucleotidyl transferase AbiEii toxin, Type IV TA system
MSRENATPGLIAATRLVLGEIAKILETYPRAVIAGGSVPYLLIPQDIEPHEGTVDIDVVLDIDQPAADEVYTLHELLERRLFQQDPKKPFRYTKGVEVEGEQYQVLIELLAGGDPPPNGLHRIQTEDVYVSIIQGMEVALENPLEVSLPENSSQSVSVASLPAFFSMKAVALSRRAELKKTKDAYDIVYCLRNYPGGVDAMAKEFRNAISNPIVASGVELLRDLFAATDSIGPVAYAREADDFEHAILKQREAFERVTELLDRIQRVK